MFNQIAMVVVCALVMSLVQAEVHAMLSAVAYARKFDGSLMQKLRIGAVRYNWASIVFSESDAYSFFGPVVSAFAVFVGLVAAMYFDVVPFNPGTALSGALFTGVGYFGFVFGPAFAESRAVIEEHSKAGTWAIA